jgi:two-component system, LuxR family, response regulator FixJ
MIEGPAAMVQVTVCMTVQLALCIMNGKFAVDQNIIPWNGSYADVTPVREIFVVDDDEDVGDILAGSLAPVGFPVTNFTDASSFLRVVRTRVPICIFLDIEMPHRSGLEILKELRAQQFLAPIVIVSARDDFSTVVEAMKNGAHDYLKKPFDFDAPVLRARSAVEVWSRRQHKKIAMDIHEVESEWFRLTPSEKDMLFLMRSFDI